LRKKRKIKSGDDKKGSPAWEKPKPSGANQREW